MNKKASAGAFVGIFLIVAVIIGGVLLSGYDVVDASHTGVKVKFGKVLGTQPAGREWTGLMVDVHQYDLRLRKMDVTMAGNQGAVDKDGQSVFATIQINYKLNPLAVQRVYSEVGRDGKQLADQLNLDGIIREGFKSVTSGYSSLEIFQKRPEIKEKVIEKIGENFPSDYFILENVIISNIDFNPAFKAAIEQAKVAEEMAKAKTEEVKVAQAQADINVAQAEGAKQVAMKKAESDAYLIERMARAEALALELKARELTPLMVENNWIDAWNGALPKYNLGGNTNMLMSMPE